MGDGILSGFWFNLRARAQREQRAFWLGLARWDGMGWGCVFSYRATLALHFSSRLKKGQFLGLRPKNGTVINTLMSRVWPFDNLNLRF
ncbi:hypothetical protein TorRG33x02_066940 [Trema orientale]|uniref:Uncharacterized protein n=1 Tax=Trema orientale TaxID=63057 RepID=A0A2P5FI78_TREOI|nr:hypothetical protein TorRG33x02_066940 [Trema orientale]